MSADSRKAKWPSQRPVMPRLAASAPSKGKTPPVPKIAPHLASAITSSPRSTPRRPPITNSPDSSSFRVQDESVTPIKDLERSNVTPRSTARSSRGGSAQSTPTGQIAGASPGPRQLPAQNLSFAGRVASARPDPLASERSESDLNSIHRDPVNGYATGGTTTPSTPQSNVSSAVSQGARRSQENSDDYFFLANEARQREPARKPVTHKKTPSFVYANGEQDTHSDSERQFNSARVVGNEGFHSNGVTSHNGIAAANSMSSDDSFFPPRIASPPRQAAPFHLQKSASQISQQNGFSSSSPPISSVLEHGPGHRHEKRQTKLNWSLGTRSRKAPSISSQDSASSNPKSHPAPTSFFPQLPPKESPLASPPLASCDKPHSDLLETAHRHSGAFDPLQSPTSAAGSSAEGTLQRAESAANARRERKVLDLEISNSSLLAINRSLEKEMRKQKAEIRRLRRATRNSHRVSCVSSTRVSDMSVGGLSGLSEEDEEAGLGGELEESDDERDVSDEESLAADGWSTGALAQDDTKHHRSDQRRLQLDLEKHKELLADSQKMNQGLKRCLGLTDQLIADGSKALRYQVEMTDVRLGGKVLNGESEYDEDSMLRDGCEATYEGSLHEERKAQNTLRPSQNSESLLESLNDLLEGEAPPLRQEPSPLRRIPSPTLQE